MGDVPEHEHEWPEHEHPESLLNRVAKAFYSKDTGKDNRRFARGRWVRVATNVGTGNGADILMQAQWNVRVPLTARYMKVRFVRARSNGERDGTGDCHLFTGFRTGRNFQWTYQHGIEDFDGKIDVEMYVPGRGKFTLKYLYVKIFQ